MRHKPWEESIRRLGGLTPIPGKNFMPLSESELEAVEAALGSMLPEDYRDFLATYGASTFNCLTSIRADGPLPPSLSDDGLVPFGLFYGTNREAHAFPSLLFCAEQFVGEIPATLLPIADGGSDDQICIGLVGEARGRIFYWDSQGGSDDSDDGATGAGGTSEAPAANVYYVAASFTELLNQIESYSGEDKAAP